MKNSRRKFRYSRKNNKFFRYFDNNLAKGIFLAVAIMLLVFSALMTAAKE